MAWRRDRQGPPFQTNFVRAQRVLQMSALMPVAGSPAGPGGRKNLARRALERIEVVKARFGTRPVWLP